MDNRANGIIGTVNGDNSGDRQRRPKVISHKYEKTEAIIVSVNDKIIEETWDAKLFSF